MTAEDGIRLADPALWSPEPGPVDPGSGTRADRLRMLRRMREVWRAANTERHARIDAELRAARERRPEVTAYWEQHRKLVVSRWAVRTGGRGQTTVADISEVAAQWHPANSLTSREVSATAQQRGTASPYLWQCPLDPEHPPWPAWPKDRIQKGTGCPACRKLVRLSDIPSLAEQYDGTGSVRDIPFSAHDEVPWLCRAWALDPVTGHWRRAEHRFTAVVKDRSQQGNGCLVCAGYRVDDTNSLATWFPELAEQLDDPHLDPRLLSTSEHNARKNGDTDTGGAYAFYPWRCKHGHQWPATVLNRVQGSDCGSCSTAGISKEQVYLVAELAWLMELVVPGNHDPRLPDGVPDFASHKITVPAQFRPAHWRYKYVEVDAQFRIPSHQVTLGLEYDGAYHHSAGLRERTSYEADKSAVLYAAGIADAVIHVRVGALPELRAPRALAVLVPEGATAYQQACAVAVAVEDRYPGSIPLLDEYEAGGQARARAHAEDYIRATWGELRPPSPKRHRTEPRQPRRLRATSPADGSLLIPIGEPRRNPDKPVEIIRDYRCACGTKQFTAVQSQVTSGNTRSCGCLRSRATRQAGPAASRVEGQAARAWAAQNGVKSANDIPMTRIIASYRLHQAGHEEALGEDNLVETRLVQQWAHIRNMPLGARGRIPSRLWLHFADNYMADHSQS